MIFVLWTLSLGIGVGLVSAALGVGGGIFMVPAFIEFVPGMDPHTAKGTSLFIIIFVAAANVWRLNQEGENRQWDLAAFLAAGSIVGSMFSVWLTGLLPGRAVLLFFITLLIVVGIRMLLLAEPKAAAAQRVRWRVLAALLIGLATGLVSGATGVGGGLILVPLVLIAGLARNERVAALSNTVMVPTCIAATLIGLLEPKSTDLAWTVGQVDFALAPLVFLGAQAGSLAGKHLNRWLTLPRRRVVMGMLLLLIVARLAWRAFG